MPSWCKLHHVPHVSCRARPYRPCVTYLPDCFTELEPDSTALCYVCVFTHTRPTMSCIRLVLLLKLYYVVCGSSDRDIHNLVSYVVVITILGWNSSKFVCSSYLIYCISMMPHKMSVLKCALISIMCPASYKPVKVLLMLMHCHEKNGPPPGQILRSIWTPGPCTSE